MNKKALIVLLAISAAMTSCGNTDSAVDPIVPESTASVEVTTAAVTSVSGITTQITTTEKTTTESTATTKETKPETTTAKSTESDTTLSQTEPETQTQSVTQAPVTQAPQTQTQAPATQATSKATSKVTAAETTKVTSKETKATSKQTEPPKQQTAVEEAYKAVRGNTSNAAQREVVRQEIIKYVLEHYGGKLDNSLCLFTNPDGTLSNTNTRENHPGGNGQWIGFMTPDCTWDEFMNFEVPYWCDIEINRLQSGGYNKLNRFNIVAWESDAFDGRYIFTFVVSPYDS